MADVPIAVFGCVRTYQESFLDCVTSVTRTIVHLPVMDWYLVDTVHHEHPVRNNTLVVGGYPAFVKGYTHQTCTPIIMAAMELPLASMVALIDRLILESQDWLSNTDVQRLGEFKEAIVVRAFRVKAAAKTFQRQFREAMANPAYHMCHKRLLGEFLELQPCK
jgi:hypothetical protein